MGVSDPKIALCQVVNAVFALIALSCLASEITFRNEPNYRSDTQQGIYPGRQPFDEQPSSFWWIHGSSAHVLLFVISSSAFLNGLISIFTPDADGSIVRSPFFWILNGVYALFFFGGSISLFVYLGAYSREVRQTDIISRYPGKPVSYAGAAFALMAAMSHIATTMLSRAKSKD